MSISIVEVAKAAGVSTATVSRVINELPGVRNDTIQLVQDAIRNLNYKPQRIRRGPKRHILMNVRKALRTGNIAAITLGQSREWLQLPVMASVVTGISRAANEHELGLLLDAQPDPDRLSPLVQEKKIDGAIVFVTGSWPLAAQDAALSALRKKLPVVWVMGMEVAAAGVDHVAPDNIRTGYLAHEYLTAKGCQSTAVLCANPDWAFMRLRSQSFLNASYDSGNPATAYVVGSNPLSIDPFGKNVVAEPTLEALIARLATANPRPQGLFITNDHLTAQCYPILHRHGLTPGQNITIVSCDNESIRLSALHPRPASVDIGAEEIGYRSVNCLISRVRRPSDPPTIMHVAPSLVHGS